ncbi:hypothetical protein HID58_074043 [Brassica napus]|uniref:TOD1/MUCI70 glycosyltransferase-like domain-containing protein n=1 Tax=Brassica napus TaxID=3708 RepID=A0ABQ7YFK3_BRANA|nr:hypothetical protein HID58_074043 [Brassica napus]
MEELEGLADPMRKEVALARKENDSLLPPEELEHLDTLERKESSSTVKKLVYLTGADSSSPVRGNMIRFNLFTGNQTFAERESSFQVSETVSGHCGFSTRIEGLEFWMRIRISACAFGGGDNLDQPIGMSKASTQKVCYVSFWDDVTLATQEAEGHNSGETLFR